MPAEAARSWESEPNIDAGSEEKTARFLLELTMLSVRHGVGIAGQPTLFVMEQDDYDRTYKIDDNSKLSFD